MTIHQSLLFQSDYQVDKGGESAERRELRELLSIQTWNGTLLLYAWQTARV